METVHGVSRFGPPCGRCRRAVNAWSLRDQGQGTARREVNAAQTSGGSSLYGHFRSLLHRAGRTVRRESVACLSTGKRDRSARQHIPLPLGKIRGVCEPGNGDRPAGPRISELRRRSQKQPRLRDDSRNGRTIRRALIVGMAREALPDSASRQPETTILSSNRLMSGSLL
jgi:hypothetical protein